MITYVIISKMHIKLLNGCTEFKTDRMKCKKGRKI